MRTGRLRYLALGAPAESGDAGGGEVLHRAGFGAAHEAFLRGLQIIVAGEMEPAVHEIKRKLGGKIAAVSLRVTGGGIGGNADLAGDAVGGIAFEGDDVGRRRVVEEIGVELRESGVGEENEGEFAGRAAAAKFGGVSVEPGDDLRDGPARHVQTRMAVGDLEGARQSGRGRRGSVFTGQPGVAFGFGTRLGPGGRLHLGGEGASARRG